MNKKRLRYIGIDVDSCSTYLSILDLVIVGVLRAGGVLANVFSFRELAVKLFAAVPAICLGEAELRLRSLYRHGQLAERCVGLLRVKSLCQSRQVYNKQ